MNVYMVRVRKEGVERDFFFEAVSDEDALDVLHRYLELRGQVLRLAAVDAGQLRFLR